MKRNWLIIGLFISVLGIIAIINAITQIETVEQQLLDQQAGLIQISDENLATIRAGSHLTYLYARGLFVAGLVISFYSVLEEIKILINRSLGRN